MANPIVSGYSCYAQKGTVIARQKKVRHTLLGSCISREKGSTLMQTRTACTCLSTGGVQLSCNKKHRHKPVVEIVSLEAKVSSSFHRCIKDPSLLFGESLKEHFAKTEKSVNLILHFCALSLKNSAWHKHNSGLPVVPSDWNWHLTVQWEQSEGCFFFVLLFLWNWLHFVFLQPQ